MAKLLIGKKSRAIVSLMLSVAILCTVMFAVSATTATDYGTKEAGITLANNGKVSDKAAVEYSSDMFNFNNGLVNFGPYTNSIWKSTLAECGVTLEDGKVKFSPVDTNTWWEGSYRGIESVPVKLPEEAKGKKVSVYVDAALDYNLTVNVLIDGVKVDRDALSNGDNSLLYSDANNLNNPSSSPVLKNINVHTNWGMYQRCQFSVPADAENIALQIIEYEHIADKYAYIDNIRILIHADEDMDYAYTDFAGKKYLSNGCEVYGAEDVGVVLIDSNDKISDTNKRPAIEANDSNFDFSQGLKYFGPLNSTWGRWSNRLAEQGVTLDNGKIKIAYTSKWTYTDYNRGIESIPVIIPEWAKGKSVSVYMDAATNEELNVTLLGNGTALKDTVRNSENLFISATETESLNRVPVYDTWKEPYIAKLTLPNTDGANIAIRIQAPNNETTLAKIDNIKFVVEETDGTYKDLITGKRCNADGTDYVDPTTDYGTENEGITLVDSNDKVNARNPIEFSQSMFDFDNGLLNFGPYTGSIWKSTLAEGGITLEDGMVKFSPVDTTSWWEGSYRGIESVPINIPEALKGKTIALFADVASDIDIQINVLIDGAKVNVEGSSGVECMVSAAACDASDKILKNYQLNTNLGSFHKSYIKVPDTAKTMALQIITFNHTADKFGYIDNITVVYQDDGGYTNKNVNIDGTPYNYNLGDANADGAVDIRDLVAIKKYDENVNTTIYKAAANCKADGIINDDDVSELRKTMLSACSGCSLDGKTLLFLGSSITKGEGSASNEYSMADYIAKRHNCTVIKEAVSSTTLKVGTSLDDTNDQSYLNRFLRRIENVDKCDRLIVQLSTNDINYPDKVGDVTSDDKKALTDFEPSTTIGAIEYIIAAAKAKYPDCEISFYTCYMGNSDTYEDMIEKLYKVKAKWGIGILDLYNDPEMRNISQENFTLFMPDQVHPNDLGYNLWWGPKFEEFLLNK